MLEQSRGWPSRAYATLRVAVVGGFPPAACVIERDHDRAAAHLNGADVAFAVEVGWLMADASAPKEPACPAAAVPDRIHHVACATWPVTALAVP